MSHKYLKTDSHRSDHDWHAHFNPGHSISLFATDAEK